MDREKLKQLAENVIEDYFECIEALVDNIVSKIAEQNKIEDEDDIDYLKAKIKRGFLKWNEKMEG